MVKTAKKLGRGDGMLMKRELRKVFKTRKKRSGMEKGFTEILLACKLSC
jgi:hypothetical protein